MKNSRRDFLIFLHLDFPCWKGNHVLHKQCRSDRGISGKAHILMHGSCRASEICINAHSLYSWLVCGSSVISVCTCTQDKYQKVFMSSRNVENIGWSVLSSIFTQSSPSMEESHHCCWDWCCWKSGMDCIFCLCPILARCKEASRQSWKDLLSREVRLDIVSEQYNRYDYVEMPLRTCNFHLPPPLRYPVEERSFNELLLTCNYPLILVSHQCCLQFVEELLRNRRQRRVTTSRFISRRFIASVQISNLRLSKTLSPTYTIHLILKLALSAGCCTELCWSYCSTSVNDSILHVKRPICP